jgi:glycosyltransferase involved in cell wall biosynthesis
MRIAQVAALFESVPPALYGGTERVIAALCDELVDAGHDVTLFGAGSSTTKARLVPIVPEPLRPRMSRQEMIDVAPHLHLQMLAEIYARAEEFDVIHSHVDLLTLPFVASTHVPTLITLHGRLDTDSSQQVFPLYPAVPLVSISDAQRQPLAGVQLDWVATVPNGLPLDPYLDQPRAADPNCFAFVGRISHEKRPDLAIEIARRTGHRLRIAAKVDPFDLEYYESQIEPLIDGTEIVFAGEISELEKPRFYAGVRALLFPSDWPEPFGLVMIESLAAGTPVIALRRGSVPEVLVDGVTGFICDDVDEMVAAVDRLHEIDPDACRAAALDFSAETMCRRYLDAYASLRQRRLPVLAAAV